MDYTDPTAFAEVYSLTTGRKQTVPRLWLDDPILGRDFRKTPSQRAADGELGARPHESDSVDSIDDYADAAGIDLDGASNRVEKVALIEDALAVGQDGDLQTGMVEVDPAPAPFDPIAPAYAAHSDTPPSPAPDSATEPPASGPGDDLTSDPTASDPSTGDTTQEN